MEAPRPLPGSGRDHRARRLARGLCLGALTLALLGPATAAAGAVAEPAVEFVAPDGLLGFIGQAQMEEAGATVRGECEYRGRAGETPQASACSGLPALTALEEAKIGSFGYLTLPRSKGTTAYLSAEELERPSSVFEGALPPLFFAAERATRFSRPPKIGDPDDVNAEDNIATVAGEALVVGVHQGHVVEVQVTPSTTSTSAGSAVEFTAAVVGGGEFTFAWTFGDGTTAAGESVSHSFSGSGTYQVRAIATSADGSGGESGPAEVVVGNPPTAAAPGATTVPQ